MLRKITFAGITLLVPILFAALCFEAYFLHGYLTFRATYCGSFAQLDDEIGWIPRPATQSCIRGHTSVFGSELFSTSVKINRDGFRAETLDSPTPKGGILAIGDSWTFGYGIEWADTFAARLGREHGRPTALLASPAYSGAQAILLARRHMASVRPHTVVYLELGFWERGVCSGTHRPARVLKPCYWAAPSGRGQLVIPEKDWVEQAAKFGLRPGGMLGAGENSLSYFLIARPFAKIEQTLVRAGWLSGFGDDFAAWGTEKDLDIARRTHLDQILSLASAWNARLVLLDPNETYGVLLREQQPPLDLVYVGASEWSERIAKPMNDLAASDARVPGDGHFGPGAHTLIANLIGSKLDEAEQKRTGARHDRAHRTSQAP